MKSYNWFPTVCLVLLIGLLGSMSGLVSSARADEGNPFDHVLINLSGPILDGNGNLLEGSLQKGPEHSSLVHILGASEAGVQPPSPNGWPDERNPVIRATFIGERTAYDAERTGLFATMFDYSTPLLGQFFVRVYDAPTVEQATYYADSEPIDFGGGHHVRVDPPVGWTMLASATPPPDVAPHPETFVANMRALGGGLQAVLSWEAEPGYTYVVEINTNSLFNPVWKYFMTIEAATPAVERVIDLPETSSGYFRIRVLQ